MAQDASRPDGSPGEVKNPVGAPTKLTPEVQEKILVAIRGGNFRGVAAGYAGINESRMSKWMKRGKVTSTGKFFKFRQAVLKAEQEAHMRAVALVLKAGPEDWKAMAWYLERKFPEMWAKKQEVQVTGKGGGAIQHEVELTPSEAVKTIEEANRAAARWAAKTAAVAEASTSAAVDAVVAETTSEPEDGADGGDHS